MKRRLRKGPGHLLPWPSRQMMQMTLLRLVPMVPDGQPGVRRLGGLLEQDTSQPIKPLPVGGAGREKTKARGGHPGPPRKNQKRLNQPGKKRQMNISRQNGRRVVAAFLPNQTGPRRMPSTLQRLRADCAARPLPTLKKSLTRLLGEAVAAPGRLMSLPGFRAGDFSRAVQKRALYSEW